MPWTETQMHFIVYTYTTNLNCTEANLTAAEILHRTLGTFAMVLRILLKLRPSNRTTVPGIPCGGE